MVAGITQRAVTVTADPAQTKTYGNANPASYTYTSTSLGTGTALVGALDRAAGENVGAYAIGQGGVTNANNTNYLLSYAGDNFAITPRAVTVTADPAQTKTYGNANPASYTYTNTGLGTGTALVGALDRAAGENVGAYAIGQGALTNANNTNYLLSYVGDNFVITGGAAVPISIFDTSPIVYVGVTNRAYYYRPGNFWHIAHSPNNADPGFDVMRGGEGLAADAARDGEAQLSGFVGRARRGASGCDSVLGSGFCETWSFPRQSGNVGGK